MNEEDNHTDVIEKINSATYAYNNDVLNGKRSLQKIVYKVSESLEQVTAKYFKEEEISVKTKEPKLLYEQIIKSTELIMSANNVGANPIVV